MRLLAILVLVNSAWARVVRSGLQEPLHHGGDDVEATHFPTVRESVLMARKIMHLSTTGTLVSVLQNDTAYNIENTVTTTDRRPQGVSGSPIGLLEYYADCDPTSGNPILLAINIATPFRNYAAGSKISLAIDWWPTRKTTYLSRLFGDFPTPHTPAALPRFSLHGQIEKVSAKDLESKAIAKCFLHAHPDSSLWQPGNEVSHESHYVRFVVEQVYWFGGFGDRARIQWLPIEEWRNVTMEEIMSTPLPGEKKSGSTWLKSWL